MQAVKSDWIDSSTYENPFQDKVPGVLTGSSTEIGEVYVGGPWSI